MGKADLKKKLKMENLLNASFELFTSQGINKTSISDIVNKAEVAKGTFYLYFKDKYDIRSRLIVHRASKLFVEAHEALLNEDTDDFTDKLIFIVNHILDCLNEDKGLLALMHKDLSWAVFKKDLTSRSYEYEIDFYEDVYRKMILKSGLEFREPEIMLSMIVELAGSAGYSSIMYNEPVPLDELKPYLADAIRAIIGLHTLK